MPDWLRADESSFEPAPASMSGGADGPSDAKVDLRRPTVTICLRGVRVLDNKKLFGSAQVRVLLIVVDGRVNTQAGMPFWTQELPFPNVSDGATLPIDVDSGFVVYRSKPEGFISLFVIIARDTEATRAFAQALKDSFVAKGIGTTVGVGITLAGASLAAPAARALTTEAVDSALDYFRTKKNPLIATYYGSLTRERQYGGGLHPPEYPRRLLACGATAELAYEVTLA
jgi:hypothetical protein